MEGGREGGREGERGGGRGREGGLKTNATMWSIRYYSLQTVRYLQLTTANCTHHLHLTTACTLSNYNILHMYIHPAGTGLTIVQHTGIHHSRQ